MSFKAGDFNLEMASNSSTLNSSTLDNERTKNENENIVDWEGSDDPANPHNWSNSKRWTHIIIVSLLTLVTNMAPTMCTPGINDIAAEFNITSDVIQTLAITLYVFGIAIGPTFITPLSEVYGRLPLYHGASIVFVAFVVGSALSKNLASFMVFRFISGCWGGLPLSLGGGTIADVTPLQHRALAMAPFSLALLAGPIFGPLIGGFVSFYKGWRWTFWILAILGGAAEVAILLFMRETHPKILLERKTARLRISLGNKDLKSKLASNRPLTPRQVLVQALIRPTMLLIRSPIVLIISLYVALVFGILFILFTTFPAVFEGQYGIGQAISGLPYLGLGVALFVSPFISLKFSGRIQAARMKADGVQHMKPEYHLLTMIWFSPFVGLGLFIYGWTAHYKVQWIVPILGTFVIGFGAFFVIMPAQLYLINLFGSDGAASALGANNLLRYLFSAFLPLAGTPLYKALGYGWGNTLLGFLTLMFVPAPILFYKYGERLRGITFN